jgi:hypothetical protein
LNPGISVFDERIAVGRGQTWKPIVERIGIATVSETLPVPDKS